MPPLVQSLAALALGLGNHDTAVPLLVEQAVGLPDSEIELKSCAIVALGLSANDAASDATTQLLALLGDRRLDSSLKALVPLALAQLDDGARVETVPALLGAFAHRDTDDLVRASLAQALGRLASTRQRAALDALAAVARHDEHVSTRHAALMALAQIGLRDADDEAAPPEAHQLIADVLRQQLQTHNATDRPWGALAAGVYARGRGLQAAALGAALLEGYVEQKDPSTRGAFAIGLGLAGVVAASGPLTEDFRSPGEPTLRGHTALALGLLGDRGVATEMLAACGDKATEPLVREQVAMGLALLRDPDVVTTLLDVLTRVQLHAVSVGVARSLGRIGDRSAITALSQIALDATRPESTRGLAVVALGLLGERGDVPWNAKLRELHNPEVRVDALQLVLDIL